MGFGPQGFVDRGKKILGSIRETPLNGTLLKVAYGSLKRDLLEGIYIPKGPPNPNF